MAKTKRTPKMPEGYYDFEREVEDVIAWLSLSTVAWGRVGLDCFDDAVLLTPKLLEFSPTGGAPVAESGLDPELHEPFTRSALRSPMRQHLDAFRYMGVSVTKLSAAQIRRLRSMRLLGDSYAKTWCKFTVLFFTHAGEGVGHTKYAWWNRTIRKWSVLKRVESVVDPLRRTASDYQAGLGSLQEYWSSDFTNLIDASFALSYGFQNVWSVSLRLDGGRGVRMFSDIVGIRDIFRLRDLPPDRDRRDALRHWVRSHNRRVIRDDTESLVEVKQHLRGATSFTWNGLSAVIHQPTAVDLS